MGAFRQTLRELGYVEGRNLILDIRWAGGQMDRLPGLAAELVRLKPHVLAVGGTPAIRAARAAATTTPIVMLAAADPVGDGFVASLTRPGGTITGMTHISPDLSARRLQLLRDAVPGVARVAVLYHPGDGGVATDLEATETAARALGLAVQRAAVQDAGNSSAPSRRSSSRGRTRW
jgi:putative ABC transport system substrate-binding protein